MLDDASGLSTAKPSVLVSIQIIASEHFKYSSESLFNTCFSVDSLSSSWCFALPCSRFKSSGHLNLSSF